MIFNEWTFALFLLVGVCGFSFLPKAKRPLWLAAVGAAFYAFYGGLWLIVFLVETAISRLYRPRSRMALFGIVQATLILLLVKYGAFFANAFNEMGVYLGLVAPRHFEALPLPLALSFFTFEFIHYAADRYNDRAPAVPQAPYAAFILFFPTMIAGPIKRVQNFTAELDHAEVNASHVWTGLTRIATGMFKKAVLADNANVFLEYAFVPEVPASARTATLWFYMVIYSFRIYLDFSAYSDMAIGSARLFGIVVPENFNWPYLARNPSEFWRRWHISLSRWITDYLYIPLGGARAGRGRTALNTLVAMGISGLWHGAAANFVVWGIYHALLLIVYRSVVPIWTRIAPAWVREHFIATSSYRILNFVAVTFGWTFFAMPLELGRRYALRMIGIR